MPSGKRLTEEQRGEVCRVYQDLGSIQRTADALGVSAFTVSKILREAGIEASYPKGRRQSEINRLAQQTAAAEYSEVIKGRYELLEPYSTARARLLHRCLIHGEEWRVCPDGLKRAIKAGGGLRCCAREKAALRGREQRQEEYDAFLKLQGRFLRLEPYQNTETPILHRCLAHQQDGLRRPIKGSVGMGCCKADSQADTRKSKWAHVEREYDQILAGYGRMVRLEPYRGLNEPIKHRCLEHGEVRLTAPSSAKRGGGLMCCRRADEMRRAQDKFERFRDRYDDRIEGRLKRLEPYQGAQVPIKHLCLIHGEEGMARPGNVIAGHGLACCRLAASGGDTLGKAIEMTLPITGQTSLYLFTMKGRPGLLKPGIAKDINVRADRHYGDLISEWVFDERHEAVICEAAVLQATRSAYWCPSDLVEWDGHGELRQMSPEEMVRVIQFHVDELREMGVWSFALKHAPLTRRQRLQCEALEEEARLEPGSCGASTARKAGCQRPDPSPLNQAS